MKRALSALAFAVLLDGCASTVPPIPAGYTGAVATFKDSFTRLSTGAANIFYLDSIDGREIENSLVATRGASFNHGMSIVPVALDRKVPAQTSTFRIVGRTDHAAPIQALTQPEYQVAGEVHFTPEADKTYVVRGELDETHSAVWIEEETGQTVMDKKIEIQGPAKLGIFEK